MPALRLKRSPPPLERIDQECWFMWLDSLYIGGDRVGAWAYGIPNASKLSGTPAERARQANNLKRQGLRPGVPDVCLAWPSGEHHGLYLEFKRIGAPAPKDGDLQDLWHKRLRMKRYDVHVVHGFEAARTTTCAYLGIPA